jgi:hypothetical protein
MWILALKQNLLGRDVILSEHHPIMAELQERRERDCPCNPGPTPLDRIVIAVAQQRRAARHAARLA